MAEEYRLRDRVQAYFWLRQLCNRARAEKSPWKVGYLDAVVVKLQRAVCKVYVEGEPVARKEAA